ncbi:DNA polymerase III subunit delta' [Ornithinimicrobium cryptoxanthini]|uniref:DNA polymerase III subunit delta n=1 Tax=Ornithinimicrobium cryptoxanthini TaxID=2934161 RepID=A0ABY4YJ40_9MICO|nr:DNA polymerase III subunit delta' [Ornithinimicrobium cryptoxanthini]USQ76709.1 DNA polymerase III subunit delta' [Ornithinimicrobium cryptoxanthini]
MSVFDDLVGQEPLVEQLQHSAANPAAMTHAWLFTGPPGSGRSKAARAFAAALQCEGGGVPGCGECQACRTVLAGSHADLIVEATSETFIRVGRARDLALAAGSRPTVGRWRVLIIEDADRLNDQAADALLKSLEEPPPRTVWMLCAPSLEDILVTIRSRCRHMRLRTPPVDAVAELLVRRDGIDAAMAHYAARAAQSHIGIARRLALDEGARTRRHRVTSIPLSLTSLGAALSAADELSTAATEGATGSAADEADEARAVLLRQLGADPSARTQPPAIRTHLKEFDERQKRLSRRRQHDTIDAALTDLSSVYRDALVLGTGAGIEAINSTEVPVLRELARAFSPDQLLQALDTIGLARQRLIANGSPLLVLEAMMVGLILPTARQGA